jgi:ribose/xylose/arabinose/galactoside ABC-type transport system permease subunit
MPPGLAMLLAIGAGSSLGLINGLLVAYARIPSIIVTLGTLAIYRAVLVAYPGNKIVVINDLPPWVSEFGSIQLFSIGEFDIRPVVAGAFVMFVIFQFVTTYLRFGRQLYAIGSNPEAARIGGLPSQRIVLSCFHIMWCNRWTGRVLVPGALWQSQHRCRSRDGIESHSRGSSGRNQYERWQRHDHGSLVRRLDD